MSKKNKHEISDLDLVKMIASGYIANSAGLEHDELISLGYIGLMDAKTRYDSDKAAWKTYAQIRIRGAIIDGIRSMMPTGYKRKDYDQSPVFCEFCELSTCSFSDTAIHGTAEQNDLKQIAQDLLPEQHYTIFEAYYLKQHTIKSISESSNISKARISTIIHKSTDKIRQIANGNIDVVT